MKIALRVYWGSYEPEYYLYIDGKYVGFWNTFHQGALPSDWTIEYDGAKIQV